MKRKGEHTLHTVAIVYALVATAILYAASKNTTVLQANQQIMIAIRCEGCLKHTTGAGQGQCHRAHAMVTGKRVQICTAARKTLGTLGPALDAREWMQMEKFNHIQPKGTMRMPNLSLNPLAKRVLKSRSVQCTPTNVQTAGYLTLLDDALHQEVNEQVKHIHVKDENLQPRTMTRMP